MLPSVTRLLGDLANAREPGSERSIPAPLRAYRIFCLLAGILVSGFWFAYRLASEAYIDPLWVRVALTFICLALVAASYYSERVAAQFDRWVLGLFCLLGLWFVGLTASNGFSTDYAVGLLFVIAAISIALSMASGPRAHLTAFQILMVIAVGAAILLSRQDVLSQLVLFCCVIGIAIVTGVGSSVRFRMEEARAEYRQGLSEANRRAEELLHLKATFLNNMNHEIRTPLTGILGYAEILVENADSEQREYAGIIQSAGQRLMETLSTILDLAHLEAGEFDLNSGHVDLERAAADAIDLLRGPAKKRGLTINLETDSHPIIARGDHAAVRRVAYNILSNAVKFTREGSISVRVFRQNGSACIEIADTGIGIEPRFIPELFCEFKQASAGLARTHEGAGLGLAISKRLADLMDGRIDVESEPGAGSTFTFSLPLPHVDLKSADA